MTIEVHEGLYLTEAGKKGTWQCYFRLGGHTTRKSTKTRDLAQAKLVALEWFQDAKNRKNLGQPVALVSYAKLRDDYLETIRGEGKYAFHAETTQRHFDPFFEGIKDVSNINDNTIIDYLKYRRGKVEKAPTPQTLNRENTIIRQMLEHAVKRKWLVEAPELKNFDERLTRRRRSHFTREEYKILIRTARTRAAELKNQPMHTKSHWSRQLMRDYVFLMANTGMRVDESKTLIWRNVNFEEGWLLLERAGKKKDTRKVIPRASAISALKRIRKRRDDYIREYGGIFKETEKVVAFPNGNPIQSMKKGFSALITACGFDYEELSDRHCLTSLRHTYATFRLTTKSGKRASMRALEKQMGTSQRMLNRHYGHDEIDDYRDELDGV